MCSIPKLFHKDRIIQVMKLTKSKLVETLRKKEEGVTSYQVRKIAGVSVRRVDQVWNEYLKKGEIPEIGKNVGRPRKMIEQWEINIVGKAYRKYRLPADLLERVIDRDFNKHIGHNRIHRILLQIGFAKPKKNKDVRKKKYKSYQRRHSLTAVHIDWHYFNGTWVFAVIDDASRKMLALIECKSPTTDKSIEGMEIALKAGKIKQCISDHGSQFVANVIDAESRFVEYLKSKGIKQILCKVRYPQSNGKIEKWFYTYDRHREAFKTIKDFLHWYNDVRPHRALKVETLETPSKAFIRKKKK
jgi:putative transposase